MSLLTRICLVRHGETEWNVVRRLQGHIDIGLNTLGLRQAEAAGRWLKDEPVSALYSSDLKRARTTAEHVGRHLRLPVTTAAELRERRYGVLEGLTHEEAAAQHPEVYARFLARDPDYAFPRGGESLVDFNRRIFSWLNAAIARHPGETIALVTHGGVLDVVNRGVRGVRLDAPRDFSIPNAGLNWISHLDGGWRVDAWAEVAHLETSALDEL